MASDAALLLSIDPHGENFHRLAVFDAVSGLFFPLLRRTRRRAPPDLFDTVVLERERSGETGAVFLRDFEVTRRRPGIARRFDRLAAAARFARTLIANGQHLPDLAEAHALAERLFDVLEETSHPEAALLKTLYLFARREGLPAREDWAARLPANDGRDLAAILHTPLEELEAPEERARFFRTELERWLVATAEFRFDP